MDLKSCLLLCSMAHTPHIQIIHTHSNHNVDFLKFGKIYALGVVCSKTGCHLQRAGWTGTENPPASDSLVLR